MSTLPVAPIHRGTGVEELSDAIGARGAPQTQSFANMLLDGIDRVDQKSKAADALVTQFALDDSVPPYRVLFAMGQAHHSLEMLMQVRARLVEAYQELMRMQL